ncbi:hypothetical protein CR513_28370, partial [Mucuna pruriens]
MYPCATIARLGSLLELALDQVFQSDMIGEYDDFGAKQIGVHRLRCIGDHVYRLADFVLLAENDSKGRVRCITHLLERGLPVRWPSTIPSVTMKWHFSKFSTRSVSMHHFSTRARFPRHASKVSAYTVKSSINTSMQSSNKSEKMLRSAWMTSPIHKKPWLKRVVPARLTRPRTKRIYRSSSPIRSDTFHCPRKQSSSTATSLLEKLAAQAIKGAETKKPKIIRGDRLDYQRTLVDPILNVLANRGEPSPFHPGDHQSVRLYRVYQRLVETMLDKSSIDPLYDLYPEIELTLRRLRKARNIVVSNSSNSFSSFVTNNSDSVEYSSSSSFTEKMENNERTLKELATPDVVYQPWCIQYLQLEPTQTYELKSGLIHLLPKFHGLAGEDPHKHLKEFHVVCSTMRPQGILEDYIKMKAFPFSLDGAGKDWLYLQLVLFNT